MLRDLSVFIKKAHPQNPGRLKKWTKAVAKRMSDQPLTEGIAEIHGVMKRQGAMTSRAMPRKQRLKVLKKDFMETLNVRGYTGKGMRLREKL
jgi:hypothetical protein